MTRDGVLVVARQELVQRVRRGRWRWVLAVWTLVLLGLVGLTDLATSDELVGRGVTLFGVLALVVLSLGLLIVPSVAAASVNGDRERGTLAVLQVTRLTSWELALGKLLASWGTTLVFLALTAPATAYAFAAGGLSVGKVLAVYAVIALLLGTVCGISLGLSAVLSRTTTSSVMAYVCVFALGAGLPIVFGLGTLATSEEILVQTPAESFTQPDGSVVTNEASEFTIQRSRPDKVWWLLAADPFVVLADAAPYRPKETIFSPNGGFSQAPPVTVLEPGQASVTGTAIAPGQPAGPPETQTGEPPRQMPKERAFDPLGEIGGAVRYLRLPPLPECYTDATCRARNRLQAEREKSDPPPVWPWGLAVDVALGALGLVAAERRLRTPSKTLPRGQRVA